MTDSDTEFVRLLAQAARWHHTAGGPRWRKAYNRVLRAANAVNMPERELLERYRVAVEAARAARDGGE